MGNSFNMSNYLRNKSSSLCNYSALPLQSSTNIIMAQSWCDLISILLYCWLLTQTSCKIWHLKNKKRFEIWQLETPETLIFRIFEKKFKLFAWKKKEYTTPQLTIYSWVLMEVGFCWCLIFLVVTGMKWMVWWVMVQCWIKGIHQCWPVIESWPGYQLMYW